MKYWVFKSEPGTYSYRDLTSEPDRTTKWDGVRNYEARNHLKDCSEGDRGFFYHSSDNPAGVVGVVEVASEPYPDPTQFDPDHAGYDPDSSEDDPTWWLVDVRAVEELPRKVALKEIKSDPALQTSVLAKRGRLSVAPLTEHQFRRIRELAEQPG